MSNWVRRLASLFVSPERLNDTWAYEQYLRWRFPDHWRSQQAEKAFYQRIVNRVGDKLVFDIGANAGNKAVMFKEIAKKVVCLEPDLACVCYLQTRFDKVDNIEIVPKGVADHEGELDFQQLERGSAYNTFSSKWVKDRESHLGLKVRSSAKVPITTLDILIEQYGIPNLIKIDVEGFELEVLRGLSSSVPFITFECNLPIFEEETLKCIQWLTTLDPQYRFNWTGQDNASWGEASWLVEEQIGQIVKGNQSGYLEIHCSNVVDF